MKRFKTIFAAGALVLGGVALYGVTMASAVAAPSITVTPSTGLTNGQQVMVAGQNYSPGDTIYIIECLANPTTSNDCNIATYATVVVANDGTFPATAFNVSTGIVSTGSCGTSTSDATCAIAAGSLTISGDKSSMNITFASAGGTTTTTTGGSTTTTTTVPPTTTTTAPKTYRPHIKVAPSAGLHNKQIVKVSGAGFKPGDHVFIVECLASVSGAAQCALSTAKPVKITSSGQLKSTTFKVITGKVGTGTCGTKASNKKTCAISVGNAAKTDATLARIAFK